MDSDGEVRVMGQALKLLEELNAPARHRVLRWLFDRLAEPAPVGGEPPPSGSLVEFLRAKSPASRIETATCITYWWQVTTKKAITTFDLGRLNDEAKMPTWSDPGSTAHGAMTTRHWLVRGEGPGTWLVSEEGRRMVEALPDRTLITETKAYG